MERALVIQTKFCFKSGTLGQVNNTLTLSCVLTVTLSQSNVSIQLSYRWTTLSNLYITLLRSSGRASIRLLCEINAAIFKKAHAPELLGEDDHLVTLDWCITRWAEKVFNKD
jgi:hypothetical protein